MFLEKSVDSVSCISFLSECGIFGLVVYLHYNNQVGGRYQR